MSLSTTTMKWTNMSTCQAIVVCIFIDRAQPSFGKILSKGRLQNKKVQNLAALSKKNLGIDPLPPP